MIGYFPTPHPDETLYSICARFSERVRYPNSKAILEELHDATTATAVFYLPNRLGFLAASLPEGTSLTVDRLIDQLTILPFFSAFLPLERVQRIREDMVSGNGAAAYMRSGLMASRIKFPDSLRFCPACKQEDKEKWGEAYWHRAHQLPGIIVCPSHRVILQSSNIKVRAGRDSLMFKPANEAANSAQLKQIEISTGDYGILEKIAHEAVWLLENPILGTFPEALHNRILRLLIDKGLATHTGSIHASKLLREFRKFYSPKLLNLLNCEFSGRDQQKTNWLLRLVRSPKHSHHPLYYLLLLQFLGCSIESFFKLPAKLNIFGEGPWPCLNPVAHHYRQLVINSFQVGDRLRYGRPIGHFVCECGFAYVRTGPDLSQDDRFRTGRVISFGKVWEKKLRELWKDLSLSISEIGRRLIADPLTIRRHATRLKLSFVGKRGKTTGLVKSLQLKSNSLAANLENKKREMRSKWLSAIKRNSKVSLKSLRKKLPREYKWLLKHDPEWLNGYKPRQIKDSPSKVSVDWKRRDAQYAALIKQSALRLRNAPGRLVRITRTAIGRDLGAVSLFKQHLHKMPLSQQMLANMVESAEEFAIRRIWWSAEQYLREGTLPQQWQLFVRANVYRYRVAVRDTVEAAMKMLNLELLRSRAAIA